MIATRDIKAGEEVVNNYGALPNSELLRGYGYVEAENSNNNVQVPLSFVIRVCKALYLKMTDGDELPEDDEEGEGEEEEDCEGDEEMLDTLGCASGLPPIPFLALRLGFARERRLIPTTNVYKLFHGR
eukprot:gene7310-428_t